MLCAACAESGCSRLGDVLVRVGEFDAVLAPQDSISLDLLLFGDKHSRDSAEESIDTCEPYISLTSDRV